MLIDTSGLYCMADSNEPDHDEAMDQFRIARRWITHSAIIPEFVALAGTRGMPQLKAVTFIRGFMQAERIEVVWVDETLTMRAFDLLLKRPDKDYSLCDAISFVVMRDHRVYNALTTDHHFAQEGFVKLLSATTDR